MHRIKFDQQDGNEYLISLGYLDGITAFLLIPNSEKIPSNEKLEGKKWVVKV